MPFYIKIPLETNNEIVNESKDYRLEVSPLFRRKSPFFSKVRYPIQREVYKAGIKIKNISSKVSPKGRVHAFAIEQEAKNFHIIDRELEVSLPELNPQQAIEIWWPDPISIPFYGVANMICKINPVNRDLSYKIFQKCEFAKTTGDLLSNDLWTGPIYIKGVMENNQDWTNRLILFLTFVTIAIACIVDFDKLRNVWSWTWNSFF